MPIDNEFYNKHPDSWWDKHGLLHLLHTAVNPARFGYFCSVLTAQLKTDPQNKTTLDVGCGGGALTEEFARIGCRVTGIDLSISSVEAAKTHATQMGLGIEYYVASAKALPFKDKSFDIITCCDVLEHVDDLKKVMEESARVLRPGGIYFYDTLNRTLWSKLSTIEFAQKWRWSRFMPADIHNWNMYIKPRELNELMAGYGLKNQETVGMSPGSNPLKIILAVIEFKRGKITYETLGQIMRLRKSGDLSSSYMGYGIKGNVERKT